MTEAHGTPTIRRLPDAEAIRMEGARSGLIHALLHVRRAIANHSPDQTYQRIPVHHTAKRRAAQAKVDALKEAERRIDDEQLGCARVLAGHRALTRGAAS